MWIALGSAVWVTACSWCDWRTRRVPNPLMIAGYLGSALLRWRWMSSEQASPIFEGLLTLSVWALAFGFWLATWWGAADAKFVMILSLAFPAPLMLLAMFLSNAVVGLLGQIAVGRPAEPTASQPVRLPGVTILGAGWLGWAAFILLGGP
jgi:Flp pilus assembly protein protease CpaA